MKLGLLTYNTPTRKTCDIACLLKLRGYEATLLTVEWKDRPTLRPLIQHRPDGFIQYPSELSQVFGWKKEMYGKNEYDMYLIGGCNIIPGLVALNAHPGYLPYVRGLDALKWAIYHGLPVGVTVHKTTNEPDQGLILARKVVPLYFEDTFHSFAYRQYMMEITMLVDAIKDDPETPEQDELTGFENRVHKRMPPHLERIMLERFEKRRKASQSMYNE